MIVLINRKNIKLWVLTLCVFNSVFVFGQNKVLDPFKDDYDNYIPDFAEKTKRWKYTEKEMERSSEVKFYTLNEVEEINRANGLVKVAIENEANGEYRKAMAMYQDIITKFSISNGHNEILYRVSPYGVFVPVAQYCQRRLLNFPKEHLDFFRTLRDPEAKELFEEATKKYSLELFSEIVDKHLATTYGGKALQFLGDAALDNGNYLEALEHFKTILNYFPDKNLQTPELNLKIQYCEKALGYTISSSGGSSKSNISEKDLQLLKSAIQLERPNKAKIHTQRSSGDYISGDDYTRFAPSSDPLGIVMPEWENDLLDSSKDYFVYAQPVITDTSVVVRLKNIIYCYSIINGNLRWKNDIGGRAVWQNWAKRQYPLEDIVIQDGVILTPLNKSGTSLVALDEITGQIKWSYGPISANEGDESLMRFECAPAGGPGSIYANYVLDNIKGDTHIDTEYGVIAFESTTGRVKWRRQICRLQPGKFDSSFGSVRRNRVRSFFTPPLYHEGTVYVSTNAGAVAAMDGLSGRIKWLMRYPYHQGVHDLTRNFGNLEPLHGGLLHVLPHTPSFWLNQRPLVIGEQLLVLPINSPYMLCLDRKTGKINWTFEKPTNGFSYLLGPLSTGEIVVTSNGRSLSRDKRGGGSFPVYLLDPKTGKELWVSPDYIMRDDQPIMTTYIRNTPFEINVNENYFETGARPFLSEDDKLIITGWTDRSPYYRPGSHIYALGQIDLKNKKILGQRRFYSGALLAGVDLVLNDENNSTSKFIENFKTIPNKTSDHLAKLEAMEKAFKDKMPINQHPAFLPFSRITFTRYGIPFELRLSARKISMVYKRNDFEAKTFEDKSLISLFGKSELSVKDGDFKNASEYLNQCLALVSPEDVNFRALIKQQYYKVYLELVRLSIIGNKSKLQMENSLGMSNTATVLAEEVETLFALSEAYYKNDDIKKAISCLRTLIEVYGHHETPISSLAANSIFYPEDATLINSTMNEIFNEARLKTGKIYKKPADKALELTSKSLNLYLSSVSPLPKEMMIRTGDLAILKLIELLKNFGGYEAEYSKIGNEELAGDKIDNLIFHIWKYAGTAKGQDTFNRIYTLSATLPEEEKRSIWRRLGHISKICKFKPSSDLMAFLSVGEKNIYKEINKSFGEKEYKIENFNDGIMIALEREGDSNSHSNLIFIGVKLPKKIGFRFSVVCFDLALGKEIWRKDEFRLKDLGKEPGFYKAYVYKDIVVVNGMYDVFGFSIKDGTQIWHYKTPHNFEIIEGIMSGNIFALCSSNETIALQVDTKSPIGEVAWQQKEDGNIYCKPYFLNDLFVSVRMFPYNITTRYRTTGSLIARMAVSDLSQIDSHPILKEGHLELPVAYFDKYLAVTDGKYLMVFDVVKMDMIWKTSLSNVDIAKDLRMRMVINDKYIVVLKEDFDIKALYCYQLSTGDILWSSDSGKSKGPNPIYSMRLDGDMLYGIGEHPGEGFYFVAHDCAKGVRKVYKAFEGYESVPLVNIRNNIYGNHIVIELQDRKLYEMIVLDKNTGELVKKIQDEGDGAIGEVGRVSMTVQNGHPILFSLSKFKY